MKQLVDRATGRTGKPASRLETDLKVELLRRGVEAHIGDAQRAGRPTAIVKRLVSGFMPHFRQFVSTEAHHVNAALNRKPVRRIQRVTPRDHNI